MLYTYANFNHAIDIMQPIAYNESK